MDSNTFEEKQAAVDLVISVYREGLCGLRESRSLLAYYLKEFAQVRDAELDAELEKVARQYKPSDE